MYQSCALHSHHNIWRDAHVPWRTFRYYNPNTRGLNFAALMDDVKVHNSKNELVELDYSWIFVSHSNKLNYLSFYSVQSILYESAVWNISMNISFPYSIILIYGEIEKKLTEISDVLTLPTQFFWSRKLKALYICFILSHKYKVQTRVLTFLVCFVLVDFTECPRQFIFLTPSLCS